MAFQFPAAPTIGQTFDAMPGLRYTWNGTGWSPTTSTIAPGDNLHPDGTVSAPGISWVNEPSAGFRRSSAKYFHSIVNGVSVWEWSDTNFLVNKPASFGGDLAVSGNSTFNSTVYCSAGVNANGYALPGNGTGTDWILRKESNIIRQYFNPAASTNHRFDYDINTGNFYIFNDTSSFLFDNNCNLTVPKGVYCGGGMAVLGADIGFPRIRYTSDNWRLEMNIGASMLSWLNPSGISYLSVAPNRVEGPLFVATGATGVDVRATYIYGSGIMQDAATGNPSWQGVKYSFIHVSGAWAGAVVWQPTCQINFMLSNGGSWGSVQAGYFDVMSDERIKDRIAPLERQHDAFAAIKPIRWYVKQKEGDSPSYPDLREKWGFSAQNLAEAVPLAVSETTSIADGELTPTLCFDPVPVLALTVLEVQELAAKVKQMERLLVSRR